MFYIGLLESMMSGQNDSFLTEIVVFIIIILGFLTYSSSCSHFPSNETEPAACQDAKKKKKRANSSVLFFVLTI